MKEQYSERKNGSRALRVLLFSLAMLLAYAPAGLAQSITVRGTVTDDSGAPLAGVYVSVQGAAATAITTTSGGYSINAPASGTLVFGLLGMATQEVPVENRALIDVTLSEDVTGIEEVVVIGYGSVKRQHLTGSVAVASSAEIKKSTVSNLTQALVGKKVGDKVNVIVPVGEMEFEIMDISL